jgi:hypothetical protein
MRVGELHGREVLDWGVAARPIAGQAVSGDLHLVRPFDSGVLLAVIDGVGHGDAATSAARQAVAILEQHVADSVIVLVQLCHRALLRTRGVVMSLASISTKEATVTWLGVGNVEGRLLRFVPSLSHPTESVLLRSGMVGYQLPSLTATVLPLAAGDLLVFATDGVRTGFDAGIDRTKSPQSIAEAILREYFKGNDDALVLVARYLGGGCD